MKQVVPKTQVARTNVLTTFKNAAKWKRPQRVKRHLWRNSAGIQGTELEDIHVYVFDIADYFTGLVT
jgi:hypothetical protein